MDRESLVDLVESVEKVDPHDLGSRVDLVGPMDRVEPTDLQRRVIQGWSDP